MCSDERDSENSIAEEAQGLKASVWQGRPPREDNCMVQDPEAPGQVQAWLKEVHVVPWEGQAWEKWFQLLMPFEVGSQPTGRSRGMGWVHDPAESILLEMVGKGWGQAWSS